MTFLSLIRLVDLPAGYIVTQVVANDVDLSSVVTYGFAEEGSGGGLFAIDPFTGVVTLTQSLDREECSHYTLRVQASDSLHQTEAEVTVNVMDVNDNPPVFSKEAYQVGIFSHNGRSTLLYISLYISPTVQQCCGPQGGPTVDIAPPVIVHQCFAVSSSEQQKCFATTVVG